MGHLKGIRELANQLAEQTLTSEDLVTQSLERARSEDAKGLFTHIDDSVLQQAVAIDKARDAAEGQVTLAGSRVLVETAQPAEADAEVVGHLRDAGMLLLGRVNMSEFAFSGMGMNPHFDPLYSVWDRQTGRLPGGSSSGSGVSVALGMVAGSLGSDTAGSCRIPAAFNGVVGVKPSYGRLSLKGVYPLSPSSDAPGPLAVDVDSCYLIDHLMTGQYSGTLPPLNARPADKLTFLVPDSVAMADLDDDVATAFEMAMMKLGVHGVNIIKQPMAVIDASIDMFLKRPVAVYEAYQHHKSMLETKGYLYDQYVRRRLYSGSNITLEEQIQRIEEKKILTRWFKKEFVKTGIDAVIFPTCPCVPPPWPGTDNIDELGAINLRCLRNTASINNVDGCSISIPGQRAGQAPVGIMVSRPHGDDQELYEIAATVEAAFNV